METVLNMVVNADNIRMLVLLACGYAYLARFRTVFEKRMDGLDHKIDMAEASLRAELKGEIAGLRVEIAELRAEIAEIRLNEIAHLNAAIIALTYTLEKNHILSREDREYVERTLAI